MRNISQIEWRELIANDANAVVIDVRNPMEWKEGVLENSLLISIQNPGIFISEVEKLEEEKNYFIYCRSGQRSLMACQILESVGYKTTYNLAGGILKWDGKIVFPAISKMEE